ncbi:hypothetical protein D3C80_1293860 [compost metagenome]
MQQQRSRQFHLGKINLYVIGKKTETVLALVHGTNRRRNRVIAQCLSLPSSRVIDSKNEMIPRRLMLLSRVQYSLTGQNRDIREPQ